MSGILGGVTLDLREAHVDLEASVEAPAMFGASTASTSGNKTG